jgi:hypothetical protein
VTESVIMNTGDALQYIEDLHAIGVGWRSTISAPAIPRWPT